MKMKKNSIAIAANGKRAYEKPTIDIHQLQPRQVLLIGSPDPTDPILPIVPEGWPDGVPLPW